MAILRCRHCGSAIDSDVRRAQCLECRALFPFQCSVCARNLRSPFPVFDDERHLTLDDAPQPLCDDHFLRKCPDCNEWFRNDENPGFFRCSNCAAKMQSAYPHPEWSDMAETVYGAETGSYSEPPGSVPLVLDARAGINPNILAIGATGCAVLVLMGWLLLGR